MIIELKDGRKIEVITIENKNEYFTTFYKNSVEKIKIKNSDIINIIY